MIRNIVERFQIGYFVETFVPTPELSNNRPIIRKIEDKAVLDLLSRIQELEADVNNVRFFSTLFSSGISIVNSSYDDSSENHIRINKPSWKPMSVNFWNSSFRKISIKYDPFSTTLGESEQLNIYLLNKKEDKRLNIELTRILFKNKEVVPSQVAFNVSPEQKQTIHRYNSL